MVLGRVGWAAKGLVWVATAVVLVQLALPGGGDQKQADQQGAIAELAETAWGTALLVLLAVGLVGYAVWRMYSAIFGRGDGLDRISAAASAIAYGFLAVLSFGKANGPAGGGSSGSSSQRPKTVTAEVFTWPLGVWLVGAVGLGLLVVAALFARQALQRSYMDALDFRRLPGRLQGTAETLGFVGSLARAFVFVLLGGFLVMAALQHDASEARGLDQALRTVAEHSLGTVVFAAASLGFLAYGLFCWVHAWCRRFDEA